ncbi:MAG TPA: hypothetical protein VH107_04145 [Lacipirellulaceae bacterium]|jgi:hypothetical protein|nr:hypothetical protein [Lacipirellulaceae bacterium]
MSRPGFQFSTRDLLIATTIIAVALATGVHFAGVAIVAVLMGALQGMILLAGDWLIRPKNRRALAFITALSWITLGCGLTIIAIKTIADASDTSALPFGWLAIEGSLLLGAAGAFLMALYRWRKLGN